VTSQRPPSSDVGSDSARTLAPELLEDLRAAIRDLPPVLHLVRPGLPAPAERSIRRLARAQRHFGLAARIVSVPDDSPPDIAELSTVDDAGDPDRAPIVHLHAEMGDPFATKLIGSGTVLQSVYSPTGHLNDHPVSVPLVVATEGVARGLRRQKLSAYVVPPVIDEEWLRQPAAPIRTGRPAVGMLCGLQPSAGADSFVSAVPAIAEARPDAAFTIVGGGPQEEPLRRLATRRGVGDIVRFVGPAEDISSLLRRLDIVVCPARQDVSALTALEAMAAGRPVVASRVGALADVLIQGETGRLVPPADPSAVAATVLRLLNRPQERQTLAAASRAYVARHHSAELGMAASVDAYRMACAGQSIPDGSERLQDALTR
jgi:glycosyltransferase involved in cell wall biosynthesis